MSPLKLRSVLPSIIIADTYKCNCSQKNPNKLNLFIYLQLAWLVRLEWLTGFISATQLDIRESDQMFFPKSGIFTVTWLILSNFQKIYVKILSRKSLKCPIEAILWNSWSVWRCKHTVPAVSISQSNFVLVFFFFTTWRISFHYSKPFVRVCWVFFSLCFRGWVPFFFLRMCRLSTESVESWAEL